MKILLVKESKIPPENYGGIQRVVYWLARDLLTLGHDVFIMADEDSSVFKDYPRIQHISPPLPHQKIEDVVPDYIDIVHYHQDPKEPPSGKYKYLVSFHTNALSNHTFYPNTVFVSKRHATVHGATTYVHNGLPIEDYPFTIDKQDYMLYMSMLNWRIKNPMLAIELSLECKRDLQLTGGWLKKSWKIWQPFMLTQYKSIKQYVHENGFVGGKKKEALLLNAGLLFFIVNWEEPCALSVLESLGAGTPVIASPNGYLPEVIEHGKNGYIVNSYEEAVTTVNKHFKLPRQQRREMSQYARDNVWSVRKMTLNYVAKYETILKNTYLYEPAEAKTFRLDPSGIKVIKK